MKNIYLQIPTDKDQISNLALATVTGTTGSTPQKPGSSALFDQSVLVAGTVGGGVLENRIQQMAIESINSGNPGYFIFRLDSSAEGGEDALCGGEISILIDPCLSKHIQTLKDLRNSAEKRIPGLLITCVEKYQNSKISVNRYWVQNGHSATVPHDILSLLDTRINKMIQDSDAYGYREIKVPERGDEPGKMIFIESVIPPPRLIIAGAGHIGKALSIIGRMLDFEITVIDDRREYANPENIPDADHFVNDNIGKAISAIEKGDDTYFVIVTRGHKDDGDALKACIGSDAAYIGMIGSRTKVALMRKEFIDKGWATIEQWDRIFTPIGLDIKSKTVEEIAVSIAAQLIQVKNKSL